MCSKESSCSGSFVEADSVEDCCLTKGALTYQSNTGMCSQCIGECGLPNNTRECKFSCSPLLFVNDNSWQSQSGGD